MDYDLDLDALAPEAKKVKLNGQIIEVYPPKFNNLVSLMKLVTEIRGAGNDTDKSYQAIEKLRSSLCPIIPSLKDEALDLSIEQLNVLLEFVMKIATPQDQASLEKQGYSIGTEDKKKIETSVE